MFFFLKHIQKSPWVLDIIGKAPDVITDTSFNKVDDPSPCLMTEEQKIRKELIMFRNHYENCVDYQIIDDGMLPTYEIGSSVAGIPYLDEICANVSSALIASNTIFFC